MMSREQIIDSIVRRTLPRVIEMCRYTNIDIVFANGQRRGGVRSVVRQAWRAEVGRRAP